MSLYCMAVVVTIAGIHFTNCLLIYLICTDLTLYSLKKTEIISNLHLVCTASNCTKL